MPHSPPITDAMRAYAREHPDSWLYLVDPAYQEDPDPPPHAVLGAYRIRPDGAVDERFHANDAYRPSELASARLEPSTALERVLLRISDGRSAEDALPAAVLDDQVLLYAAAPADTTVYTAEMSDGTHLVPACTSHARVPTFWPACRPVPGHALPALLNGHDLGLNLDDPIQAVIPYRRLREAAETTRPSS
ncbi:type VII secretion system-associated protein [Bounagaea algeriensis]